MRRRPAVMLSLVLLLGAAGCSSDSDPGPGGVSQGEAHALDDAAAMLDARPAPPLVDATVPADIGSEAAAPDAKP